MSFIFLEILVLSLIATKAESKDNFRAKVYTGKEVKTTNSTTLGVSLIQCQNMCVLARRMGTSNICGYDKVSKTCFYSFDTEYDVLSTSEVTKVVLIPVEDACQSSEYLVNGMEPVSDDQITASSVFNEAHDTNGSRLHSVTTSSRVGAWVAGTADTNQYIQVQFNCPNHVIGVAMQGRPISTDPNSYMYRGVGCCYQRVTAYKLLYSGDCVNYLTIRDSSGSDVPEMRFTLEEELNPTFLFTFICRERDFIQLCNNYRLNVVDSEDLFEKILDSLQDVKQSGLRVRPLLFETMKTVAHLKLPNLEIRWRPACKTRVAQHNKMRQEEKEADRKRLERKCRNQREEIETMEAMRVEMDRMRAEIAELREEVRSLKEGAKTCTAPSTEMAEQSRIPRPKGPASATAHRSLFAAVRRRPGFAAGSASTTSTACRTTTASTTARSTSARSTAATVGSSTRKTTSARSSAATAPSMPSAGGQTSAPSTSSAGGQTVEGGAARGRGKVSTKRKRVDDDGGQAKKKPAWK
ncbi:uncharacterized protein LOC128241083 [Mya arenaria]|nr:uncharacterized protein LOC128241083 [Mya arenaria]